MHRRSAGQIFGPRAHEIELDQGPAQFRPVFWLGIPRCRNDVPIEGIRHGELRVHYGPRVDIIEIVSGPIYISAMSPRTRYWTLHWLRVLLWPAPVLSLFRAGRWAMSSIHRR
jgi:hypothetical protein